MALPMLASGADCGPSNPLQGLSKRFEQDRGLQQDYFGANRVASARETFRTQYAGPSTSDQDAARFFASGSNPEPQLLEGLAYDVSALRTALPASQMRLPIQAQQNPPAAWASDFLQQQPVQTTNGHLVNALPALQQSQKAAPTVAEYEGSVMPQGVTWNPGYMVNSMPRFMPSAPMHAQQQPANHAIQTSSWDSWEKEFVKHGVIAVPEVLSNEVQQDLQQRPKDADELARTAGLLLENVKDEQNPKFLNSQFMSLMKQLRDGRIIVDGNQMIESDGSVVTPVDVKGKGRAISTSNVGLTGDFHSLANQAIRNPEIHGSQVDPNDAYFRQENAEYTQFWNDAERLDNIQDIPTKTVNSWDRLQADWDEFEATATGIRPLDSYQFQTNNPYLLGDSSNTRHHRLHSGGMQSTLESVLELEALTQRDMTNAYAWFELGVKQQENEREHKALQALQRAVELDPSHLPTWLALAISYTNDNNRTGTHDSIQEWVNRNDKYRSAVEEFRARNVQSGAESYTDLIQCLMAMARSDISGEVDADIQVALAVLLNTNGDYEKAQDCFRTALAVRPMDWLLYNRVGATMANNGHAEEALEYYYQALMLNPGYIRARYNLGISCINLRRYEEAAQHILDALVLQDSDSVRDSKGLNEKRGVTSTALWDSLKTTCLHMQRVDLATLCDRQDLDGFRMKFSN